MAKMNQKEQYKIKQPPIHRLYRYIYVFIAFSTLLLVRYLLYLLYLLSKRSGLLDKIFSGVAPSLNALLI